jgi:hypothetical protein
MADVTTTPPGRTGSVRVLISVSSPSDAAEILRHAKVIEYSAPWEREHRPENLGTRPFTFENGISIFEIERLLDAIQPQKGRHEERIRN